MVRLIRIALLVAIASGVAMPARAGDNYFCAVDQAAGLAFDKQAGTWHAALFNPDGKYLIRPLHAEESESLKSYFGFDFDEKLGVFPAGQTVPTAACHWTARNGDQLFSCRFVGAYVIFNVQTLRFQVTHVGNYAYPPSGGSDVLTPSIEGGRCTPM